MPEVGTDKVISTKAESFERSLNLKQLQISRILNITQAINGNLSEEGLYDMLKSFLTWELGVAKMALFTQVNNQWSLVASQNIQHAVMDSTVIDLITPFDRTSNLKDHPLSELGFSIIIPVRHKSQGIAYLLIGDIKLDVNEERYNLIQMITTIVNIIAVAIENKKLFKRQLEQQGLKREMELGRDMQQMLVPQELPSNSKYVLNAVYRPKLSIGGDYYDCVEFGEEGFAFCVADISGKGIGAALLMANFQANFQSLIRQRVPLEELIIALNTSVNKITKGEKFITFFVAEVNLQKGQMRYINAGHNPPMHFSGNEVYRLSTGCTILGSFDVLPNIECGVQEIHEGDIIFAFTDGLVEIQNEKEEYFSEENIVKLVQANRSECCDMLNQQVYQSAKAFATNDQLDDDFTLLSCRIKSLS